MRIKTCKTAAVASSLRSQDRLLAALCRPGASAVPAVADPGAFLTVSAQTRGVSIAVMTAPAAAGVGLESAGLAHWLRSGQGHAGRLAATDAGRARAARLAAGEEGAPFLAQHAPLVREAVARGEAPLLRDAAESPLAWLARRKGRDGVALIDPAGFAAGERLRSDIAMAQMLPRVTSDWSGNAGGGGGASAIHFSEAAAAARQRVDRALAAAGEDVAGLLLDVCGFLKGLEACESDRGWPQRSARVVLVLALGRLARHYGLSVAAKGPARAAGLRQWGAPGFRPSLSAGQA